MKHYYKPPVLERPIVADVPRELPAIFFECLFGKHRAEVLHRGTAYCRACYDDRNPFGKLIDP